MPQACHALLQRLSYINQFSQLFDVGTLTTMTEITSKTLHLHESRLLGLLGRYTVYIKAINEITYIVSVFFSLKAKGPNRASTTAPCWQSLETLLARRPRGFARCTPPLKLVKHKWLERPLTGATGAENSF